MSLPRSQFALDDAVCKISSEAARLILKAGHGAGLGNYNLSMFYATIHLGYLGILSMFKLNQLKSG
jgi:hypothetical protein